MTINHKRIICTVTNDLSQDQRMYRICNSLSQHSYEVTLVGRKLPNSLPLMDSSFQTHRLPCYFSKGFLFYLEFNLRLFLFLLSQKVDIINSIDLDTLLAGRIASWIKKIHFTFDAHELFTEVPELHDQPIRRSIWKLIENVFIKGDISCYTVNESLAQLLNKRTKKTFNIVQNYPRFKEARQNKLSTKTIDLVYQGMLNKGRGLEELIAAVGSRKDLRLHIIGRGDLEDDIRRLSEEHSNVLLLGFVKHEELHTMTSQYHIGFNLLKEESANYYYSSANKFFDFIMAGLPVISMNFPEYRKVNEQFKVGELVDDLSQTSILSAIDAILKDYDSYARTCIVARDIFQWESQEKTLISIYDSL